jgi:hypothetical protein
MQTLDDLTEAYAKHILESMSYQELWAFALEALQDNLATYGDERLLDEIKEFAPRLLTAPEQTPKVL